MSDQTFVNIALELIKENNFSSPEEFVKNELFDKMKSVITLTGKNNISIEYYVPPSSRYFNLDARYLNDEKWIRIKFLNFRD